MLSLNNETLMNNKVLDITNLSIGYSLPIVREINCSVRKGEFVVLFGANGAGKSTFIKTILQQQARFTGEIKLNNSKLSSYSSLELAKEIAIVSTTTQFDLNLTVYDLLALGRIPYLNLFGKLNENDKKCIDKYITLLDLKHLLAQAFHTLSDGQKQKVLIARALIQDTPIIILDEPTAHLDVKNRMMIFKLLNEIATQQEKAIVCATHEIDFALKYCTSVWLIDKHQNFITDDASKFNTDTVYCNLF